MMRHMMKTIVFFIFAIPLVSAAVHSQQYFYTAVTSGINFPEYTAVGLVDGEQFLYYDSNIRKVTPKTDWIKKNEGEDYWNSVTEIFQGAQDTFKVGVDTLTKRFNQTSGVHTFQYMYGCELDDGNKKGYSQFGYDGADFISFDKNTLTYTAANPQAVPTKHKWEKEPGSTVGRKNYLENICIEWLQKYVEYGRDTLERKVLPKVDMFQADSSSPVVCHATGFFPKEVMISWQKNGEDMDEGVEVRETLRNQDGSFQKRSILTVTPEKLDTDQYTCVVQHEGLEKEIVMKAEDRRVLSGGVTVGIIIIAVVAVLLAIIGCVGVFIWKKKSGKDFKPVSQAPSDADSSSNNSTGEKA